MKTGIVNAFKKSVMKKLLVLGIFSMVCTVVSAQDTHATGNASVFTNELFLAMISVIFLLLIVILVMAQVLKSSAKYCSEKSQGQSGIVTKSLMILITFSFIYDAASAQDVIAAPALNAGAYWGLDGATFFGLLSIIAIEMFVIGLFYNLIMQLIGEKERKRILAAEKAVKPVKKVSLIDKLNDSVKIENEEEILFDHNYDGIRELDNNLPPWWKYGFYVTILWGVVYLIHYHVSHTGKLQKAEYEEQLAQAKVEIEEYRKKAANLVDENNATLLTDAPSLSSGKTIYMENCSACHGRAGEGGVGPNLTDDYWVHSGGIGDIFKTIKYGYPEKGMKSWQQDLGAKQIHEVASYIKSLRGTTPPNPKEKQGELYLEPSEKTTLPDSLQIVLR